jgi:hypothetical protein
MRSARFSELFCAFLFTFPLWAQQGASTQPASVTKPVLDPQAVGIVNQALAVAGGATAISAIHDYRASGNITYHSNPVVQASVTLSGLGLDQFRQDANLPTGVRSLAISQGKMNQKLEDGGVLLMNTIPPLSPSSLAFPYPLLIGALTRPGYSVSYIGIVQIDGHSAHDIRVQPFLPDTVDAKDLIAALQATDFLIDTSTFQILMIQDMIRTIRDMSVGHLHEIRFSDYRNVNGVLAPFSVNETIGGQKARDITLDNIRFNSGLLDTDFQLSSSTGR